MLIGLLKDVWFYVSAGGFLASLVLFVFLLGQYRLAVEAEEYDEEDRQDSPDISPISEEVEPALEETLFEHPMEHPIMESPVLRDIAQDPDIPPEITPAPQQPAAINTADAGERRMQVFEEDLKDISIEVKALNTGMASFMGEIKSVEKLLAEQSRKNIEVFERLSELLKNQKPGLLETAALSLLPDEKLAPEQRGKPSPPIEKIPRLQKIQEEPLPLEPLKLQLPKTNEPAAIIEPTTVLGVRKIDMPAKEEKSTLPPIEEKHFEKPLPQEETPSFKSPLKLKGPQDIQALKEEAISPRKGPVWPM
jgi:hypothetical protein